MRWGLTLGAAAGLGAAALITTQWSGQPAATAPAAASHAPSRDAIVKGLEQARGAEAAAVALATAPMELAAPLANMRLDPSAAFDSDSTTAIAADADGPAGERRITFKSRIEASGSRITQYTEYEAKESRAGSRSNASARLRVSLDYCPDKDGKVIAEIEYRASSDTALANAAGTAGYSVNLSAKGRATASVDDQALLAHVDQDLDYEVTDRGGQMLKDAAGQASNTRKASSGTIRIVSSMPVTSTEVPGSKDINVRLGAGGKARFEAGTSDDPAFTQYMATLTDVLLDGVVRGLFNSAQTKWRGGACLELVVRAPVHGGGKTNPMQPKERKNFEVAVRHKTEQAELPLPLEATLDGRDTLEPRRAEKAPGRFDYVAGPDPQDHGNVALESVSRRGIARERVVFDNRQHLGGTFSARTSGVMQTQAEGRVSWQPKPDAPGFFVPSGSLRVSGTRRNCTVRGEGEITAADGELQLERDAQGQPVEYRGHGIKTMPLHFTCGRVSATQTLPVAWFATAGAFRPAGPDGTLEGALEQGGVHWSWRFTP